MEEDKPVKKGLDIYEVFGFPDANVDSQTGSNTFEVEPSQAKLGNLLGAKAVEAAAIYQRFAQEKLGFEFNDVSILISALVHSRYVNEHSIEFDHNERLEFLGDAVLELVVRDYLYDNFTDREGTLTSLSTALVRTESLGRAATELGYESLLRMSKDPADQGSQGRLKALANAFEAVLGAVYKDRGYDDAASVVKRYIISQLDAILEHELWKNPKGDLQSYAQANFEFQPTYVINKELGPDHEKRFEVSVFNGDNLLGSGSGRTKRTAEQDAAKNALNGLLSK